MWRYRRQVDVGGLTAEHNSRLTMLSAHDKDVIMRDMGVGDGRRHVGSCPYPGLASTACSSAARNVLAIRIAREPSETPGAVEEPGRR